MKNHINFCLFSMLLILSGNLHSAEPSRLQELCASVIANDPALLDLAAKRLPVQDFKPIMAAYANKGLLTRVDRPLRTITTVTDDLRGSSAINHDNSLVAATTTHNKIKIYHIHSNNLIQTLNFYAEKLLFHPSKNILACRENDQHVQLWDIDMKKKICQLNGQDVRSHFSSFAFHPHESLFATGSYFGTIDIWDIATGEHRTNIPTEQGRSIASLAFNPDGTLLASGGETVKLWDTKTGTLLTDLYQDQSNARICGLAFHPHGTILAAIKYDGTIQIWNVLTNKCLQTMIHQDMPPGWQQMLPRFDSRKTLTFCAGGTVLSSGCADYSKGQTHLWDPRTGEHLHTLKGLMKFVSFSPDGTLATYSAKKKYSIKHSKIVQQFVDYNALLMNAPFSAGEIQFLYQAARDWNSNTEHPVDFQSPVYRNLFFKLPLLWDNKLGTQLFIPEDYSRVRNIVRKVRVKALLVAATAAFLYAYHNFNTQDLDETLLFDDRLMLNRGIENFIYPIILLFIAWHYS